MKRVGYILVVEDNADVRESLVECLADEGHEVASAEHGGAALALLRASPQLPSLILLDLMMPVMDGKTFRREQRIDPVLSVVPVVLLSAGNDLAKQAEDLGVAAFLAKPANVDVLLETVERHRRKQVA